MQSSSHVLAVAFSSLKHKMLFKSIQDFIQLLSIFFLLQLFVAMKLLDLDRIADFELAVDQECCAPIFCKNFVCTPSSQYGLKVWKQTGIHGHGYQVSRKTGR